MVASVLFFATEVDEQALLDHIFGSCNCKVFRVAKVRTDSPEFLDRLALPPADEACRRFGILNSDLGGLSVIRQPPSLPAASRSKSDAFNVINWGRLAPGPGEGIIDWDRTPALFWERSVTTADGQLHWGGIGSQATSMDNVSPDFRRWVNRTMDWVRRRGVKVAQGGRPTPVAADLTIRVAIGNALFALPDAMQRLRQEGRSGGPNNGVQTDNASHCR